MGKLSADDVARAAEELVPAAAPVRPVTALRKGRSHQSWVLDSAQGPLVGKVALRSPNPAMVNRLAEHQRIAGFGVPVPEVLAFTPSSTHVHGRMVIVARYLPGSDAEEVFPVLPESKVLAAIRETGRALGMLHQVPVPSFGSVDTGLGSGPSSWADYTMGRIQQLEHLHRDSPADTASLVTAGLKLLWHMAEEVSPVVSPAAAHLDLYLPNILLDQEDCFSTLLDLEHLRWVDPAMDFVKPGMWIFGDHPEWRASFLDGYRSTAGANEYWGERMSVATGLELLSGVHYWTRVDAEDMRRDYLRRLKAWVDSDGENSAWST
jgi:aminoglycoside phosphotransferase (APT) family kinase protein